jgi:hypothetical protein
VDAWQQRPPGANVELAPGRTAEFPRAPDELTREWEGDGSAQCIGEALWRIRAAPKGWDPHRTPRLVIMHSVLGDERGYERVHVAACEDREVLSFRHIGLNDRYIDYGDIVDVQSMADRYANELVAHCGDEPFDLFGAYFGSLAYRCAVACQRLGSPPKRLVLIDPPQPTAPPMRAMAKAFRMSFRLAAEALVLMPVHLQSSNPVGQTRGDDEREAEKIAISHLMRRCRALPEECLPYLLVKEGMSGLGLDIQADSPLVEAAVIQVCKRIKSFQHCVSMLWGEWAGNGPPVQVFAPPTGATSIFVVASEPSELCNLMMLLGLKSSAPQAGEWAQVAGVDVDALAACLSKYSDVDSAIALFHDPDRQQVMYDDVASLWPSALSSFKAWLEKDGEGMHDPAALDTTFFGIAISCISRKDIRSVLAPSSLVGPALATSTSVQTYRAFTALDLDVPGENHLRASVRDLGTGAVEPGRGNTWRDRLEQQLRNHRQALMQHLTRRLKVCLPSASAPPLPDE